MDNQITSIKKKAIESEKVIKNNRKIILVTGASSGLGLSLAKKLIKDDGYFLVLTAKKASQLVV